MSGKEAMSSDNKKSNGQRRSYERISATAWLCAYHRTFLHIPLASEIFDELRKDELQQIVRQTRPATEIRKLGELKYPQLTPVWEARFKIVNRLLKEYHIDQILEIGSGFSPRGLEMARDPSVEYVEVDLPEVMREKRRILERLRAQSKVPEQPNLHLEEGNALDTQDLLSSARFFKAKPIAVVNEGLLNYLNSEEKATVARNVHQLLERFNGVWITPDIPTKTRVVMSNEERQERAARMEDISGVDMSKNRFENEEAARSFFGNLGFSVERRGFMDVADELVSPKRWGVSQELVEKILGALVVFVMKTDPVTEKT